MQRTKTPSQAKLPIWTLHTLLPLSTPAVHIWLEQPPEFPFRRLGLPVAKTETRLNATHDLGLLSVIHERRPSL